MQQTAKTIAFHYHSFRSTPPQLWTSPLGLSESTTKRHTLVLNAKIFFKKTNQHRRTYNRNAVLTRKKKKRMKFQS